MFRKTLPSVLMLAAVSLLPGCYTGLQDDSSNYLDDTMYQIVYRIPIASGASTVSGMVTWSVIHQLEFEQPPSRLPE